MDDYAAWLIDELEAIGEPVDLVGHDWGGGFTVRVVSLRPDLVRSWVSDAAGLADVNFEWHDFAKIWQTPGDGEAFFEGMLAAPAADRAAALAAGGMPEDDALVAAEALNASMAACILDLYRSATKVQDAWGPGLRRHPEAGDGHRPERGRVLERRWCAALGGEGGSAGRPSCPGSATGGCSKTPSGAPQLLEEFWASV